MFSLKPTPPTQPRPNPTLTPSKPYIRPDNLEPRRRGPYQYTIGVNFSTRTPNLLSLRPQEQVDIFANSGVYVFFEADAANPAPAQPHSDAIQAYIRPDNLEPRRRVAGRTGSGKLSWDFFVFLQKGQSETQRESERDSIPFTNNLSNIKLNYGCQDPILWQEVVVTMSCVHLAQLLMFCHFVNCLKMCDFLEDFGANLA